MASNNDDDGDDATESHQNSSSSSSSSSYYSEESSSVVPSSVSKLSKPSQVEKSGASSTSGDEKEGNGNKSVSSFFDSNKAPESAYKAKIRKEKEFQEQKKENEIRRALERANRSGSFEELKDNNLPLAPDHYTVELKRRKWDDDLKKFRENQRKLLRNIRVTSKKRVAEVHERIFFTLRWANPELPSTFKKTVLEYCAHLMGPFPERRYPKINVLKAWYSKFSHTAEGKVVDEIKILCERLRVMVLKRDEKTVNAIVNLEQKTELLTIKKEGDLRWHMETMHCARDDYWTIWYLTRRNHVLELERMLESCSDVDARDPDFGLTSLHYACKESHWEAFSLLLKHGANVLSIIEEDGRSPLHLAAQYGSKEMCLELLALGANFEAKDKYGSTALDLAIQSKNYPNIKVLQNWNHLVPPEDDDVDIVENLSDVPEEFLSTPYEVLITMSPALRVLTTRLEGTDVNATHSLDSGMDPKVEIRLCERRCNMCLEEGFEYEALKSKKRRWTVAKRAYLKQVEDKENSSLQDKVESKGADSRGDTHEGGDAKSTILTTSFLYSICCDLFEHLITKGKFEESESIMSEGLAVLQLEDAVKVMLLKRHCQLLLYLADRKDKELDSFSAFPGSAPSSSLAIPKTSQVCDEFNHMTSYASLNIESQSMTFESGGNEFMSTAPSAIAQQPSVMAENRVLNPCATAPSVLQQSVLESSHDNSSRDHLTEKVSATAERSLPQSSSVPHNVSAHDMILMRAESEVMLALDILKQNYDFNFIEPVVLSPILELAAEVADRQGRYGDALHFMEHSATVKERTLGQAHCDTVRVFIESLRLLLRKHLVLAASRKEKRDHMTREEDKILNESVSSRLMNEKRINKIREARRLEGVAEDKKYFSEVGLQATDVSRRLDRLSLENEEEALKLSTKCYNLVSLTELIVQGEIDANKVLPNSFESISLQSLRAKGYPTEAHALKRTPFNESKLAL